MRVSYFIFILLLLLCCSTKTHVAYRVYNIDDPSLVIDSISKSGTVVSDLRSMSYINDDSVFVVSDMGTLYRDGRACGSLHIQKKDSMYVVKVLDNFKKK